MNFTTFNILFWNNNSPTSKNICNELSGLSKDKSQFQDILWAHYYHSMQVSISWIKWYFDDIFYDEIKSCKAS